MTNLYQIKDLTISGITFSAGIIFNPSHPLFAGHFPGQPIVPGVVLIEISAAVMSQVIGKELTVKEASMVKFLQVIDPLKEQIVIVEGSFVDEGNGIYKADLSIAGDGIIFAKLKGIRFV